MGDSNNPQRRTGLRARGRRNSKVLECAARFLCFSNYVSDYGKWCDFDTIYYSMTFKNGNLYKNHRFARKKGTLLSHMQGHPAFKQNTKKQWSFDKSKFEQYFGVDPIIRSKEDKQYKVYRGKGT